MLPTSPDGRSLQEPVLSLQHAVLIMRVERGAVLYLLAATPAGLPKKLEADAVVGLFAINLFDAEARAVIELFVDAGWFGVDEMLAVVARVPTMHGAGRAARRRAEQGQ